MAIPFHKEEFSWYVSAVPTPSSCVTTTDVCPSAPLRSLGPPLHVHCRNLVAAARWRSRPRGGWRSRPAGPRRLRSGSGRRAEVTKGTRGRTRRTGSSDCVSLRPLFISQQCSLVILRPHDLGHFFSDWLFFFPDEASLCPFRAAIFFGHGRWQQRLTEIWCSVSDVHSW